MNTEADFGPIDIRALKDIQSLNLQNPSEELAAVTGTPAEQISKFLSRKAVFSSGFLKHFYAHYYPETGVTSDMETFEEKEAQGTKQTKIEFGRQLQALQKLVDKQQSLIVDLQERTEFLARQLGKGEF